MYIISEIGINHNGNMLEAKRLIEASAQAGANAVKVQVRDLNEIYTKTVLKDPLKAEQGTQYLLDELKRSHLNYDQIRELHNYTKSLKIDFFGTPFDIRSARFLESLGVETFKIGSPDFDNLLLLEEIAKFNKHVILSTGMSREEDIDQVTMFLKEHDVSFSLLHCNSTYPASYEDIHLNYIPIMKKRYEVKIGYSGHEQGYAVTLAAVAIGAEIIERHITRDRSQEGPDHSASLNCQQFGEMVESIRQIELSLGRAERVRNQGSMGNALNLCKSLVAARDITSGATLTNEDITTKTPAKGVSPLRLSEFLGSTINRDIETDEYLFPEFLIGNRDTVKMEFDINKKWGIVGRLNDFRDYLDLKPKLVEIHLTWRDLVGYNIEGSYEQDLVIHAPEYYHDKLIDFTSEDNETTSYSIEMLESVIDLARDLDDHFLGQTDSRGPRVVVHPGGHFSRQNSMSNRSRQYRQLVKNLRRINTDGVQILVENMPPFPWYFGGQWYNTIFLDPNEIKQFAQEMGWGVCFDTSHAQLHCRHAGITLDSFAKTILEHIDYLHISDAKGTTEEGLQIGHGEIDFETILQILQKLDVGFVPEIWMGHLNKGRGFKEALTALEPLFSKISGKGCDQNTP